MKHEKGIKYNLSPTYRAYTDRIPGVLVNVYFCRGLSKNIQRRSICKVYIEINTNTYTRKL
jgi:hypothetical protein